MTPDAAVHAYARHLAEGGTATWPQWWAAEGGSVADPAGVALTPTDLQVEVLRRLAAAGTPDLPGLAEVVLATPAAGRGRLEAPLPWPPAPVPALPASELLRVCCPVLVTLLARLTGPLGPTGGSGRTAGHAARPVSWRQRRRRRREPVRLAAGPFESMMAHAWRARVATGATIGWPRFWRRAEVRDAVPRGADPARAAADLARASGARPVRVVVEQDPFATEEPDLVGVDLWRRVNLVLRHSSLAHDRVAAVLPRLLAPAVDEHPCRALAAPAANRDWAGRAAERVADALARGGRSGDYAVDGDVGLVRRGLDAPGAAHRPRAEQTLERALVACGRAWQEVRR